MVEREDKDKSISEIKTYFESRPDVDAVYLFGSTAKGFARKKSDIDLAVLFANNITAMERFEHKLAIANDLERLLETKIDVVDMESADLFLLRQIMLHKKLLIDKNTERRVSFEVKKRREYFDRKHFYDLYHRQALDRLSKKRRNLKHG